MSVNLGTATAKLVVNAGPFSQGLSQAEKSLAGFQGRTQTVGFGLSELGRTLGVAGAAIAGGLIEATKTAASFQEAMLNVASISKDVAGNLQGFSQQILDLATTSARAPDELAKALYQVISAGIGAGEAINIVAVSAKAATAGLSDTATAATAITAVLNAGIKDAAGNFLDASTAADKLFEIVDKGVFTFPELAAQIGDVTALAGELGLNIDDIGAAFITLSQIGVKASEVPTQLVAILNSLLKPTADFTAALAQQGLTTNDLIHDLSKPGGLGDVLAVINEITKGDAANIGLVTSNIRAIKGELGLTTNAGQRFIQAEKDMANSSGALNEALTQQRKSLNFALRDFSANIKVLAIEVGGSFVPVLTALTHGLTELVQIIQKIPQPIKSVVAFFAAGVATFLLAGSALAFLTQKIFNILAAIRILSEIGVLNILPFSALINPVKLLVSGFGLFGSVLIGIVSPLRLIGSLFNLIVAPVKLLGFLFTPLIDIVKSLGVFFGLFRLAVASATGPVEVIGFAISLLVASLTTLIAPIVAVVAALALLGAAIGLAADAHGAWDAITSKVGGLTDTLKNLLNLGGPLKEFFGVAAKGTTQTDQKKPAGPGFFGFNVVDVRHQAKELLTERHKFRDQLAAAVGRGGFKQKTAFFGGIEVVTGQTRKDVAFLKQLDHSLKDTGKEVRAWTTKFQIGRRAMRDFFDFLGSGETKNGLNTFKARLQDVFGQKAGQDLFNATQKMRQGIETLNKALSDRLGIQNVISLAGATLLLIDGLNALSKFIRTDIVPAIGEFSSIVLNLGADLISLAGNVIAGDFSAALNDFVALIKDSFSQIVIPIGKILVDASSAIIDWVSGTAPDIGRMILDLLFGNSGPSEIKSLSGGASSGSVIDTQGVVGWLLHVAPPTLVGWIESGGVQDIIDKLLAVVFGAGATGSTPTAGGARGTPFAGAPGNAAAIDTGAVIDWIVSTAEPKLVGWILGGAGAFIDLLDKAVTKIIGDTPVAINKTIHWLVNVGTPQLINKTGDLFNEVKKLLSPQIDAMSGLVLGSVDRARVNVSAWAVQAADGLGSLFDEIKKFVHIQIPSPGTVYDTISGAIVNVGSWTINEGSGLGKIFDQVVSFVSDRIPPSADIFGKIEGAKVQIMSWAVDVASEAGSLFDKLKEKVTGLLPSPGTVLGTLGGAIGSASGAVVEIGSWLVQEAADSGLLAALTKFANDALGKYAGTTLAVLGGAVAGGMVGGPVGALAGGALGGAIVELAGWDVTGDPSGLLTAIGDFIAKAWAQVKDTVHQLVGNVKVTPPGVDVVGSTEKGAGSAEDRITASMFGAPDEKTFAEKLHDSVQKFFDKAADQAFSKPFVLSTEQNKSIQKSLQDVIGEGVRLAADAAVLGPVVLVALAAKGLVIGVEMIANVIGGVIGGIGIGISKSATDINNAFNPLIDKIIGLLDKLTLPADTGSRLKSAGGKVGGAVLGFLWDGIKFGMAHPFGATGGGGGGGGLGGFGGITDTAKGISSSIADFVDVQSIIDGIMGPINKAIDGVKGAIAKIDFSGLIKSLGDALTGAFSKKITIPDLNPFGGDSKTVNISPIDWTQAITNLVANLTGFDFTTIDFGGVASGIINAIVKAIGDVKDFGSSVATAISNNFGVPDFSTIGKAIWEGLKSAVIAAIEPGFLKSIIDTIKANIPGAGGGTKTPAPSAGTGAVQCSDGTFANSIDECVSGGHQTVPQAPAPKQGKFPTISRGVTAAEVLGSGFPISVTIDQIIKLPAFKLPTAASDSFLGSIKTMFTTAQTDSVVGGTGIATGVGTGISAGATGAGGALQSTQDLGTGIINVLTTTTTLAQDQGTAIATSVGTGINSGATGAGGALQATQDLGTGVINILTTTAPLAQDQGVATGEGYGAGVGSAAGDAASAAAGLVGSVLNELAAGIDAAFSYGQSVGISYTAGIESMIGAASAAGAALAAASSAGVAAANKQGSPSKVFIDLGKTAGASYAMGLGLTKELARAAGIAMAKSSLPSIPRSIIRDPSFSVHGAGHTGPIMHNPTFIVPNLNTADQVERYFRRLSTVG